MITDAFEGFAHTLRILPEVVYRAYELVRVDAHEAAGNVEQALTSVLNAFHSVYDSAREDSRISFDWYGAPETAAILAIRNARHHNLASRVRGLFTYYLQTAQPGEPRSYLVVDCALPTDGGATMEVPISWHDVRSMLMMPAMESKLRASASKAIYDYLSGDLLDRYAKHYKVPPEAVFINATPLLVNAAHRFVPLLKSHINARSVEAETYLDHFETVSFADTHSHVLRRITLALPV